MTTEDDERWSRRECASEELRVSLLSLSLLPLLLLMTKTKVSGRRREEKAASAAVGATGSTAIIFFDKFRKGWKRVCKISWNDTSCSFSSA